MSHRDFLTGSIKENGLDFLLSFIVTRTTQTVSSFRAGLHFRTRWTIVIIVINVFDVYTAIFTKTT